MGDRNRQYREERYSCGRRRHSGHGLGKGISLLIIGCVLIAIGLSFGGHVTGLGWWPGHDWSFGFNREFNSNDDRVLGAVEVLEGTLGEGTEFIDIRLRAASLVIKTGPVAGYRAVDFVKDSVRIVTDGKKISVEENDWSIEDRFGKNFKRPVLELTLTETMILETCQISVGAGTVNLEGIQTDRFSVKSGAGSIKAQNIEADRAIIENGAGSLEFFECAFDDTDIKTGAGQVVFEGELRDQTRISTGAGAVDLKLAGSLNEYRIDFERGFGSVRIGEESYNGVGNGTAGNSDAARRIKLATGLGAVRIAFEP